MSEEIVQPGQTQTPPPVEPPVTPPSEEPIHKGMIGDIKTQSELVDYTKALEAKLVEVNLANQTKASMPGNQPMTPPPSAKDELDEIEDMIFTNPKEALKKHADYILNKVEDKRSALERRTQFWDTFYTENPDLKGLERVVKSVEKEKVDELRPLSVSEARKKLAEESRKMVNLVKDRVGVKREELPAGGATIIGSGGHSPSTKQPAGGGQVLNFTEQLKNMQRGRGKKL